MGSRRWLYGVALALASTAVGAEPVAPGIVLVQPSAYGVPANLLRISIEFTAPVEGPALPRLALMRNKGTLVESPFLEQELWSPNARVLTILLHPGRVKTGLQARDQLGAIFEKGEEVTLTWDGSPIKRWKIEAADESGPSPSAWKLSSLRAGTKQALVVTMDAPIDGRGVGLLAVVDGREHLVSGRARLTAGESIWTFSPVRPWRAGKYKLLIASTLEDPAGNRLGSHFEIPAGVTRPKEVDASLAFTVPGN